MTGRPWTPLVVLPAGVFCRACQKYHLCIHKRPRDYIGEECVETVLKGNVAADEEDDQLLIDNQSPTTLISSDNVPNFVSFTYNMSDCLEKLIFLCLHSPGIYFRCEGRSSGGLPCC